MDARDADVAFFAREEGRNKVADGAAQGGRGRPAARSRGERRQAVGAARAGSPARARELGLELDTRRAAKALIAQVGERQQRLLRELEKLALEHGAGATHQRRRGRGVQRLLGRAQGLDARRRARRRRRAGRDPVARRAARPGRAAARPALPDRPPAADALAIAEALAAGQPPGEVRRRRCGCRRAPPTGFMADVAKRDVDALRRALEVMADLELESRGGGAAWARSTRTRGGAGGARARADVRARSRRRNGGRVGERVRTRAAGESGRPPRDGQRVLDATAVDVCSPRCPAADG